MNSGDPDRRPGRYLDANGATLYYEENGEGAPLVLIHGGLGSSAEWGH